MSCLDLLIHVGLHKTGTTTVQEVLFANSLALKTHGILYPETGLFGSQHALIPGCFIANHPFLHLASADDSLQFYLDSLRLELDQVRPALTVISSEVFTEIIHERETCLELIDVLSLPFSRTSLLLTRRKAPELALSNLKHRQREHFAESSMECPEAIMNPLAAFLEASSLAEQAARFWQESGLTVHERTMEEASGSLADHYLGDIFEEYSSDARSLLCPETNPAISAINRLNSDDLDSVAYLTLFLLGNACDTFLFTRKPTLAIIVDECADAVLRHSPFPVIGTGHLLRYLKYFLAGDQPCLSALIPTTQKILALAHAGLDQQQISALLAVVNHVKRRVATHTPLPEPHL